MNIQEQVRTLSPQKRALLALRGRLSFSQQRVWFLEQLQKTGGVYNLPAAMRLEGQMNCHALRLGLAEVVRRHESLRSTFLTTDGQPFYIVHKQMDVPCQFTDLRNLSAEARSAEIDRIMGEESARLFDLESGPLVRSVLLRMGREEHLLLVTMHHIVSDGWSVAIFFRELAALYEAFVQGKHSPFPELPTAYSAFARWQREALQGESFNTQIGYWREHLKGAPHITELPADYARAKAQTMRGASQIVTLSRELSDSLRDLAHRNGATLFMVLLAGFQALVGRFSGQEDIVVGSPIANRTRQEFEETIGLFINTLVMRADLSGDPGFTDLLVRVKRTTLEAHEHQDLPFERLVEELHPDRNLAHNPLFQLLFVYLVQPPRIAELPGLRLIPVEGQAAISRFDLTLSVSEGPKGLLCKLEYSRDLFTAETILRIAACYQNLLSGIAAHSERRLSELPLLDDTQRRQMLVDFQPAAHAISESKLLPASFERQVRQTPGHVAAVFGEHRLTYAELNGRANQVARCLQKQGIAPGELVGLYLERSLEMLVGMVAVMKAGAAFVPLDPNYPQERIAFLIDDSRIRLLLTQRSLCSQIPDAKLRLVCMDETQAFETPSAANLSVAIRPEWIAYVIYTSGSTGKPKGVPVSHRALMNFMSSMMSEPGVGENDRLLAVTTISFDIAGLELLLPLVAGAQVVIASSSEYSNGLRLAQALEQRQITVMQATPVTWQLLIQAGWAGNGNLKMLCGGEALARDLAAELLVRGESLWNLYGPTETTIWSAVEKVMPGAGPVAIGRPIANTAIHLLDRAMQLTPVGVPAELYIGGMGLAAGYLRRPELTAERFVPDPFSSVPGGRLYRTGDVARRLTDGRLEYLGRTDQQIKLRGFRIEPGEIESVLRLHVGVRDAAVVMHEKAPADKSLVAYLIAENAAVPSAAELRAFLQEKLPPHMLPSFFAFVDSFPQTPNGKIDRNKLGQGALAQAAASGEVVAPRTPLEEQIARIWEQLLKVEKAGVETSFFELGGHSLLAIQMLHEIRVNLGVEIPLRFLFESPMVAGLATEVARLRVEQSTDGMGLQPLPAIEPDVASRHLPFPLNDVQQAYWVGRSGALDLGNVSSHNYFEIDFPALDVGVFRQAIDRVVERHDMLRAVVLPDGSQQILEKVPPYELKVTDVRNVDAAERQNRLLALREKMSHQVLPADRWPLFDVCCSLLAAGRVRVHFSLDYLIADAWSTGIIFRELFRFYEDLALRLAPLELSFRDCVLAEAARRGSVLHLKAEEYWRRRAQDLPPAPDLPLQKSLSEIERPQFVRRSQHLTSGQWESMKSRAARAGITPSAALLAAFSEVLGAWSKSPRFTLNLTLFNRPPVHPQIFDIVGDFTVLNLLAIDNSRPGSFGLRARSLQEQLWADMEHRSVGGVAVLRELARIQGKSSQPLMPVVFTSILGQQNSDADSDNAIPLFDRRDVVYGISQTPQVWLDHQVTERAGGLHFNWDVVEELFPEGLLDEMFGSYCMLLRRLASEEQVWQEERVDLLPARQREQREQLNATGVPVPEGLLHERVAEQARRQADRIAVVSGERRLTYGDLLRRWQGVGRKLRKLGARPNQLVGVVMEKGWEQVVAALGIQESGAAYLPIDPGLPAQRYRHLLEKGEVQWVVTQPWIDARLEWPEGIGRLVVQWEEGAEEKPDAEEAEWKSAQTPEDLAYVIFTSGSTGEPKGVMIDHRGALNTVVDVNQRFSVGVEDRVLALSSLSFDLSVYDIFGVLLAGGTMVMPEPGSMRDPQHWLELMKREKVTMWNSVPALMEMLVHHAGTGEEGRVEGMRLVMMSGDWIPVSLPERIRQWSPGVELISMGGATEASIWSILYPIGAVEAGWASIPYGRPMANQTFAVLDHRMEPAPVWVPGQLHIGGIGLAKGYWRDAERTAASFIVHPKTGEKLYRTGDLGRYLPDGNIEFLGREDFQVKIQGHRIELGEIEAALEQHPLVRAAAAVAIGQKNDRWLAAFVVMKDQAEAIDAELRTFLRGRLPEYMVPVAFTAIEQLPLSSNGKVDRQALVQRLPRPGARSVAEDQRPRTPIEEKLARLWAEVLGIGQVGIHQNLFELGGNSLVAIRIVTRVREVFDVDLPLRKFFQALTVAGVAELIHEARQKRSDRKQSSLDQYLVTPDIEHRHDPFPLNDVQHAYWMGRNQFFELGNVAGHGYVELDLFGADLQRLERALHRLIARHGMLRAVMLSDGRQRILEHVPEYRIKIQDLRCRSKSEEDAGLKEVRCRMSHQMMPPERWPLFEVAASLLEEGRIRLNVSIDLLIVDAWSARILFREMALLYVDPEREMEELELSFRDYVLGELAFHNSDLYRESQDYWKRRVQVLPPAPDLPMVKGLGEVDSPRFVRRSGWLESGIWERLKGRAASAGLTPSSALLAAFAEVLSAWSRTPKFVLNLTVYHRLPVHPQVNQIVGDSTSLNLVAVDNSRSGSFALRSRALQEQLWEDLEHRYVGGVAVVRELARTHKKTQAALAPVVFTSNLFGEQQLEDKPGEDQPGLRFEQVFGISQTPQVWLDLQVRERGGNLSFNWDWVEDLFPEGLLEEMFEAFCGLLTRLAEEDQTWQEEIPGLLPVAQRRQREEINAIAASAPEELLHQRIAEHARQAPDRVAVVGGGRRVTYGELMRRSRALGKKLQEVGAQPNRLVAVVMEKGWEQIVGVLGVLESGAAYLPIDPDLPRQRLWRLLESGEVAWVLTQPGVDERLEWPQQIARMLVQWDELPRENAEAENRKPAQKPDDLAYVLFTSGSTGTPKGVMISHRAALNTVVDVNRRFGVAGHDRVLGISALNFDLSVYDIFGVLSAGGTLVLPDPGGARDPGHWLDLMKAEEVTLWNSVPALMEMLVHHAGDQPQYAVDSLRAVMLSGDWIPVGLPDRIRKWSPQAQVISLGGPTEASIWQVFYPIGAVDPAWSSIPYGRPLSNHRIEILDHRLEPVPVWVPGELYLGGAGLAEGYWKDPERTQAAFIQHPRTGERLYRSGDIGRFLPDGNIEFLGREDFQVKIRGHRIELGEIEAVLEQHPRVRQAAAVAVGEKNERWLAAFVVCEGQPPAEEELKESLVSRLPDYMIPRAIKVLNELPLTANGKLDRPALLQLQPLLQAQAKAEKERPRTLTEEKLVRLWAELLKMEAVGIHQNLFELGGNSLLAIRIVTRVREMFGVELPLRELFRKFTVAGMAELLYQTRQKQSEEKKASLERYAIVADPQHRDEPFPLNDVQYAYWIGRNQFFELGNVAAHGYVELDFYGLDLNRLEQALRRLIRRHEMLRAVMLNDGQQRILSHVPDYEIKTQDLRERTNSDAESALQQLRQRMSHQVLPAEQWPLFEIAASVLEENRIRLNISIDILIVDAWSSRILFREMAMLYANPEAKLEDIELSFRDYVLGEMTFRDSDLYRDSREYWKRRVSDLPPAPDLPMKKALGEVDRPQFVRHSGDLAPAEWEHLKQRAARAGLTPSAALLAAFAEVLTVWSKSPRFTINLTVFNRMPLHAQVNQVVGDFTSLNLVAVDNTRAGTLELRARAVQDQLWEDMQHRYMGGVAVLRELARSQKKAPAVLAPVVFTSNLYGGELLQQEGSEQGGVRGEQVYGISQTPQVWLDHQVTERAGGLHFNWDVVEELFPEGLLDEMFGSYCMLLRRLASEEQVWQEERVDLLPARQREQREQLNATGVPVPEGLLHERVAEQARRQADRIAVVSGERRLTYGDLLRRWQGVGRKLRKLGARPNQLVGVVMEKGWEQVVAALGIQESGAAYLPIDPGLPAQRYRHLLEKGEVQWVVTQPWIDARLEWPEGIGRLVVQWEEGAEEKPDAEEAEWKSAQMPEDLAYVIFTSGSTGEPKGVMIDHRGALNTVVDVNQRFSVGVEDRVLALSSLSFDLSVYDIFGVLLAGGTMVMPEPGSMRDPQHWLELMKREKVTMWNSVPALMEMLVHHAGTGEEGRVEGMRLVMMSGDWIPVSLPERIRQWSPGVELISMGGATEASIWSILYPIGAVEAGWASIPYGRPMANQTFAVLDHRMEPAPVWVPGQLYIGGIGLAKGYWRDAERTAASFIVHPKTGEKLYRTGDLGRYLPDGNIEFLGREDFQVKIQGHRIELGEIEAALEQCPEVRSGAVAAIGRDRTNRRLVAYVVLNPSGAAKPKELSVAGIAEPGTNGHHPVSTSACDGSAANGAGHHDPERIAALLAFNGREHAAGSIPLTVELHDFNGPAAPVATAFSPEPLPLSKLEGLLTCMMQLRMDDPPLPKYRYPSAGHLYPVQMYVLVRPRRIPGILSGLYYYHPKEHRLALLTSMSQIDKGALAEIDRRTDEQSAFVIFLLARMDAVVPMYGPLAADFCLLEGGYMGRLLSTTAAGHEIALSPVTGMDFSSFSDIFKVSGDAVLVNALQGGTSATASEDGGVGQKNPPEPGPESAWTRMESLLHRGRAQSSLPQLRNDIERLEFKLREAGLRKLEGNQTTIQFERPNADAILVQDYIYRQSDRDFLRRPIPLAKLGSCLFHLSREGRESHSLTATPGPNGAEALQVYLYIKKNAVEGVAGGTYHYLLGHSLELISKDAEIDGGYYGGVNLPVFEQSAFSVYFVGRPSALESQWARDILLLEAGALGQDLMMAAPRNHIGLCAIGSLNFDAIRPLLGLTSPDCILLHSFCGGLIAPRLRPAPSLAGCISGVGVAAPEKVSRETLRPSSSELTEKVRAFLVGRLPEYMVPTLIVELKDLPLSSNGKVDRNALPSIDAETAELSGKFVSPGNPVEQRFADIWSDLLGVKQVGIHDNFFTLGGDSVKGIQFLSRARQQGMDVAVREFFSHPTIAEMARTVVGSDAAVAGDGETPEREPSAEGVFPDSDLSPDEIGELIEEFGGAEQKA